jgi:hypothetical protein
VAATATIFLVGGHFADRAFKANNRFGLFLFAMAEALFALGQILVQRDVFGRFDLELAVESTDLGHVRGALGLAACQFVFEPAVVGLESAHFDFELMNLLRVFDVLALAVLEVRSAGLQLPEQVAVSSQQSRDAQEQQQRDQEKDHKRDPIAPSQEPIPALPRFKFAGKRHDFSIRFFQIAR